MIVRSGQPFTLRDLFDRFSLISIQRRVDRYCRPLGGMRKLVASRGMPIGVFAINGAFREDHHHT